MKNNLVTLEALRERERERERRHLTTAFLLNKINASACNFASAKNNENKKTNFM